MKNETTVPALTPRTLESLIEKLGQLTNTHLLRFPFYQGRAKELIAEYVASELATATAQLEAAQRELIQEKSVSEGRKRVLFEKAEEVSNEWKRAEAAESQLTVTTVELGRAKDATDFLLKLAQLGGRIVSSGDCSVLEIATARACGRFVVIDSLGFVLRPRAETMESDNLRGALLRVTGSLGLIIKGAGADAPGHKANYENAKKVLDETFREESAAAQPVATPAQGEGKERG